MMNNQPNLQVTKLLMAETGTYNQQFRRPYETTVDNMHLRAFEERMHDAGNNFSPMAFAGLAHSMVRPAAEHEGSINIPGNWNEKRLRFMMELVVNYQIGTQIMLVVLGYTDHVGFLAGSQTFDPNMRFFVNSVLQNRITESMTPVGVQQNTTVIESSHILANRDFGSALDIHQHTQRMRPQDVFTAMTRPALGRLGGDVYDTRTISTNSAVKSRRDNNLPAAYMNRVLRSYSDATIQTENEGMHSIQELASAARDNAKEPLMARDPFMAWLSNLRGTAANNDFTWAELNMLSPNVDSVTHVSLSGGIQRVGANNHHAGMTQFWDGGDLITQNATILAQAIPSLMMGVGLTRLSFQIANTEGYNGPVFVVLDIDSFSSVDQSQAISAFQNMLIRTVMDDLSSNNQIAYMLEMRVDMLGETWISLSMDNQPFVDFCVPSFSDALLVPVLTTSNDRVTTLAEDFRRLGQTLTDLKPSQTPLTGSGPGFQSIL